MVDCRLVRPAAVLLALCALLAVQGCSSIAEGVTRGLTTGSDAKPEPRPCDITGAAFEGLSGRLHRLQHSG